jgi:hypothetical protein
MEKHVPNHQPVYIYGILIHHPEQFGHLAMIRPAEFDGVNDIPTSGD